MKPADWLMLVFIGTFCAIVYAATTPQIHIDCGSLAGTGTAYIKIGENLYRHAFECGEEA